MVLFSFVFLLLVISGTDGILRLRSHTGLLNTDEADETRRSSEVSLDRPKMINWRSDSKLATLLKKSLQRPGVLNWRSDGSSKESSGTDQEEERRSIENSFQRPKALSWRSDTILDKVLLNLRRTTDNLQEKPGKLNWRLDNAERSSDDVFQRPGELNWRSDTMVHSLLEKNTKYGWKLNANGVGQLCNSHPIKMCAGKDLKSCWFVKETHCFTMKATNQKSKTK